MKKISNLTKSIERKTLTVQEVADALALSPMTIRKCIKMGKIQAIQISPKGRYRIHVSSLNEFLETKKNELL